MNRKRKIIVMAAAALLGIATLLYLGGVLGQFFANYDLWRQSGGMTGKAAMQPVDWNPSVCFPCAFTAAGLRGMGILLLMGAGLAAYVKFQSRFGNGDYDLRGFSISKEGTYGTAAWMSEKEMKSVLEVQPVDQAEMRLLCGAQ